MVGIGVEIEDNAIEDLASQILNVAEGLDDLNPSLTRLAIDIQRSMQSTTSFNDGRQRNLRRSIRAVVQDNTLTIRMLYYGYYLSFGTRDGNKNPLTAEVASAFPGKEEGSYFKQPDNNAGIAARNFYPDDIQILIADMIEAMAAENIED